MKPCNEKYAAFYRDHAHRLPGLKPPEECQDIPILPAGIEEPKAADMAKNFTVAVSRWAVAGFPVVTKKVYQARAKACAGCKLWDASARRGLGKCKHKKCGCTKFKRFLATEKCPLKKWPA